MGNFWDDFVFRVCIGLGEQFFPGFRTACNLLRTAHQLNLLDVGRLNDLSLLLIILTCPTDWALHEEAAQEFLHRGLTAGQEWAILRQALAPRLTDLFLLGFFGEPRQAALVQRIAYTLYQPALVRFMARLALIDTMTAHAFAAPYGGRTFRALSYAEILDEEFLCQLYGQVVNSGWPNAAVWPQPFPDWEASINQDERDFLNCCLDHLSSGNRCVLYLSFYALLNAEQIACIFRTLTPAPRTDDVVDGLDDSWRKVLDCLAGKRREHNQPNGTGQGNSA
jgi:hypothetical protein